MKLPRLMFACAILFWGWQWHALVLAAVLALLVEVAGSGRWQRAVSFQALCQISNACTLLFVALSVYFAFTVEPAQSVLAIIKWSPILILPLMLVIALSGMRQVPLAIISSMVRRRNPSAGASGPEHNLGWPYLALWLLSAGVANSAGPWFYVGLCLLCGWALWSVRPAVHAAGKWLALLLMAIVVGGGINLGLYRLQGVMEQVAMDWMANINEEDPLRSETSLGHIGQLKLGNGIALRVQSNRPLLEPMLLRTASYNLYMAPNWVLHGKNGFYWVRPQSNGSWPVPNQAGEHQLKHAHDPAVEHQLDIDTTASHVNPVLALPAGVSQLESEQFNGLTRNAMGTLQAYLGREHYRYRVHYESARADQSAPDAQDLVVPRKEQAALRTLVQQLQLAPQSTPAAMQKVKNWFTENFRYSTFRQGNSLGQTAIDDFLFHNRQGHCEHFASATVLLLRAAGIPARYAVGYSLQEADRFGHGYVVRQRHAHAWALVWVNGAWQDFDTTPPAWRQQERDHAPWWEALGDSLNWLIYQVRSWQIRPWHLALLLLALVLGLRLRQGMPKWQGRGRRKTKAAQGVSAFETLETSPFYQIEQYLTTHGCPRRSGEALGHWALRIAPQLGSAASVALAQIIDLHYRYRFGPPGGAIPEALRRACQDWLKDHHSCLKENASK